MELNAGAKVALDKVREKILANNIKWTFEEKECIQLVYQGITQKVLSLNCGNCMDQGSTAMNVINNFMKFYEKAPATAILNTEVIKVKPFDHIDTMTIKMMKSLLKEKNIPIPHNATRAILIDLING